MKINWLIPQNCFSSSFRYRHLWRELQSFSPVHHLPVGFLRGFWAEGRVANEHLEHDDPQGPPVTALVIASLQEHLWSYVVRGPHRGVGQGSPFAFPSFCSSLGIHRIVCEVGGLDLWKISVVFSPVGFLQSCAQTKVRKLDVTSSIKEEVVWFDVPEMVLSYSTLVNFMLIAF